MTKQYELEDLKAGMQFKCVKTTLSHPFWTEGTVYTLQDDDERMIYDNDGDPRCKKSVRRLVNGFYGLEFEEVKEMKEYTVDDIYEGMVLECVNDDDFPFWTIGKRYLVKYSYKYDELMIDDNEGEERTTQYIVNALNAVMSVQFKEIKKHVYQEGDIVEIVDNTNEHQFKIGTTVRLRERFSKKPNVDYEWSAEYLDGSDYWYVLESEMKPVDSHKSLKEPSIEEQIGKLVIAKNERHAELRKEMRKLLEESQENLQRQRELRIEAQQLQPNLEKDIKNF